MKIEGSYTFNAPREVVWSALLDPEVLANTLPGGQDLEQVAENKFKAAMKIRVGPVQGLFNGTVELSHLNPPEGYHLQVDGSGAPGFVKGTGDLRLEEQDGATVMHYSGDAQVGGRLASVGQRLMDTSAQALIRQSLEALEAQIAARQQAQKTGEPAELPAAPSQTQFALGVARKVLDERLSPEQRPELVRMGLIVLAGLLLLRALSNWWIDRIARRVAKILEKGR
ncbi:MAG: carbon monoxide dehydrogenase subunit G [Chloroflexi bacterium]|nr:carbon monoxide dehydrogenase subunit G [Chloroflexota bacterium]MCI0575707.1 carbon monoxide dehydrogenase subunit G [Chloroflexota bacterium]MCI0648049.1 carbon monoxide dehydrogenase subunit G [Chloroflexota bacterium]MCI0725806.1 carbon monoxide dehydrogenase subunit G [Chloroflexota bacterium]